MYSAYLIHKATFNSCYSSWLVNAIKTFLKFQVCQQIIGKPFKTNAHCSHYAFHWYNVLHFTEKHQVLITILD